MNHVVHQNKRTRDDFMSDSTPPLKLHIDDDALAISDTIQKQQAVIDSSYPFHIPLTRTTSFRPSERMPTNVRPPMVSFPDITQGHPLVSPPMPGELKWTSVMATPSEPAKVDEGRTYSNGLAKWSPLTWEGVAKLPPGTWLQYTSNVYPSYVERKKVVCTVGEPRHAQAGSVAVWAIMPNEFKAQIAHSNVNYHKDGCLKGLHTSKSITTSPFAECEHCPVKGWLLSPGNPSQDRRFYVSPWVLNRIH